MVLTGRILFTSKKLYAELGQSVHGRYKYAIGCLLTRTLVRLRFE
jgi:hypothetical protein